MKKDPKKFYIQLFSIHGLIRSENLELGRDADTGGQVKYVVDLTKALGEHPDVAQVDLFTRYLDDKRVSSSYKQKVEPITKNTRIVRIRCGGKRYMRKELLWPSLDEYIDNVIRFNKEHEINPDLFHGHYADAGYVTQRLSATMGIPYIFTGHSLGRSKLNSLKNEGLSLEQINKQFNINRRIEAEEDVLRSTDMVITSTRHEIKKQYFLYDNHEIPLFQVIPPGIDIEKFYPFYYDEDENREKPEEFMQARHKMHSELDRFLKDTNKPLILTICRPDSKKNIQGLVKAYGTNKELQLIANLAIFAGIRKDIDNMDDNEREVLNDLLYLMDKYDLYGKMAIPKKHDPNNEVPELYRMAAASGGVFVNSAFSEPFGLTMIEAASAGVPIVGPDDGGPQDIVKNCKNGILVDSTNPDKISNAIKQILVDVDKWTRFSSDGINGVREHYSWDAHTETYIKKIKTVTKKHNQQHAEKNKLAFPGQRFKDVEKLLITDIDDTLIGDDESMHTLLEILSGQNKTVTFGVATGRSLDLVREILSEKNIPAPHIIISSVGTEIYYGDSLDSLQPDDGWSAHISYQWKPDRVKEILSQLDFIEMQREDGERRFKLSYVMDPSDDHLATVHNKLTEAKLRYNIAYSHDAYLDILPQRASKGKAIDYMSRKWHISPKNILVAGDSGNDYEMLYGKRLAVVVGNHSNELKKLEGNKSVYFSKSPYAAGIIEGARHYNFLDNGQS
ncbi:MAG: HAD-IIB family hydrolase [Balneolales bacterium]